MKMKSGVMAGDRHKIHLQSAVQSCSGIIGTEGCDARQPHVPGYVHTMLLCGDARAEELHFVEGRLSGVFLFLPGLFLPGQVYSCPVHVRLYIEYCEQSDPLLCRISQEYPATLILMYHKRRRRISMLTG